MLISSHELLLRRSLRQLARHRLLPTLACATPTYNRSRRPFSSTPQARDGKPRDVAILGGGITGLASAHYLARADPNAKITLYEASNRLGGWMQSSHIDVSGGRILFESGPRTLRPSGNGLVTAKLLEDLNLADDIIFVPKTSPAARYRYIYYPDRLNRMPAAGEGMFARVSNLWASRDLFSGLLSGALKDIRGDVQPHSGDESIGDFIARRFDRSLADNIASAVFHGIYAGDIYKLSVRSLAPFLPYLEQTYGSCIAGLGGVLSNGRKLMERRLWDVAQDEEMTKMGVDVYRGMRQCSVFTLLGGLGQFTTRLEEVLAENDNVTFKRGTPIARILKPGEAVPASDKNTDDAQSRSVQLLDAEGQSLGAHDTVISTLAHNTLASLISPPSSAPTIYTQPSVSVMLVNLYFPSADLLARNPGFGYLIPRSVPYAQNPECALGVVFDSYAAPGQDTATGTKLTVMLGGHWWNGYGSLPSEEEGLWMARSVVARHLGIVDEPETWRVSVQRDCIPQYVVGHKEGMRGVHETLLKEFGGRVRVAGASYGGVGVNDCVRGAYDLGKGVKERGWTGAVTGLERYTSDSLGVIELVQEGGDFAPVDPSKG